MFSAIPDFLLPPLQDAATEKNKSSGEPGRNYCHAPSCSIILALHPPLSFGEFKFDLPASHLVPQTLQFISYYMGWFAQFGLNQFKRGQNCFSQLQLYLDTDKLKSCNCVCSSITARRGFAKVVCRDCDHCKYPKMHLKHLCILYEDLKNLRIICINVWGLIWNPFSNHRPYM